MQEKFEISVGKNNNNFIGEQENLVQRWSAKYCVFAWRTVGK